MDPELFVHIKSLVILHQVVQGFSCFQRLKIPHSVDDRIKCSTVLRKRHTQDKTDRRDFRNIT